MNNSNQTLRSAADKKNMTIGAAVKVNRLRDDKQYRETVAKEFNSITAEYEMKFQFMQPERGKFNFRDSDELMNFANQNDMELRGHALVWHISNPEWLEKGNWSRKELLNILETHIKTVVGRYKGQIKVWDVVNEAVGDDGKLRNNIWLQKIGPEYIELAFKWAHEADPNAKLLYNDYRAEEVNQKSNLVYDMVSDLVAKGVPIHGVGFQMHMSEDDPRNFKSVADNMKRLGNLGLEVQFTEADVRVKQPFTAARQANQAKVYQQIVETCAEAGNCDSVTIWGVTDRYSWIPGFFQGYDDALPFDENYRPKQAFNGLLKGFEEAAVQKPIPGPGGKTSPAPTPEPPEVPLPEAEGDIIEAPTEPPVNDTPETSNNGNNQDTVDDGNDGNAGGGTNTPNPAKDGTYDITAGNGNDVIQVRNSQSSINAGNGDNQIYARSSNNDLTIVAGTGNDKVRSGSGDDYIDLGSAKNYDIAFGGGGSDTFVVKKGNGYLSIRDFKQGTDKIALHGMDFDDIDQSKRNGKTWLSADGDVLVEMTNFTRPLTAADFITDGNPPANNNSQPAEPQVVVDTPEIVQENEGSETVTGNNTAQSPSGQYDITKGDGNDFIQLGKGQNSVNAGNGNNKIYVRSSPGMTDTGKDILTGTGNDKVHAGSGDDYLDLGTATNADVAFGRGGSDTFVLNQGSGVLRIRDFEQGTDQLALNDGLSFGAIEQSSRNGKTWLSTEGDVLAELTNFSGNLTASDFTNVG